MEKLKAFLKTRIMGRRLLTINPRSVQSELQLTPLEFWESMDQLKADQQINFYQTKGSSVTIYPAAILLEWITA